MKKLISHIGFIMLVSSLVMAGCKADIPEIEKPVFPEPEEPVDPPPPDEDGDDPDDSSADPQGLFDYSLVGPHPRLLMDDEELEALRMKINTTPALKTIHDIVIKRCDDDILGTSTLTYQMSGKRLLTVSRNALERIFYLSYGYRMNGTEAYLAKAEAELQAVCQFPDWNPDHYLDVGEMSLAVAIGLDWLHDDLKVETRQMARKALEDFAFKTATNAYYNTQFISAETNWNQVCNGGVALGALAVYEKNKARSAEVLELCVESNRTKGMNAYENYGCYPEGYGYWDYGTSYQVILIAALNKVFGNDNGISTARSGFMSTAEYMLFMAGTSGQCFNYADCEPAEVPKTAMWWFAARQQDPSLLFNELRLLDSGDYATSYGEKRLLPSVLVFGSNVDIPSAGVSAPRRNVWWGDGLVPAAMLRTDWTFSDSDKFFGIKGGRATASHAHMDGGSFVYDAYGERWATDLGMQSYLPLENAGIDLWNYGKFSTRWEVFRLNNHSHNTITVNGNIHHFEAKVFVDVSFMNSIGDRLATRFYSDGTLNLWVGEEDMNRWTRTAELVPNGSDHDLVLTDVLSTRAGKTADIKWQMVTPADAEIISASQIKLSQNGKTLYMNFSATDSHPFTLKKWSTDPPNSYDAANPGTVMVGFETYFGANSGATFTVKLSKDQN